ncbi:MAG: ABC transporter substrate-binding protein [Deltaproteobacteria bacterium]|jgi:hypothetical protein|nr:ABC transporter substrate-binding protein [Deltaproteobacteria bacterium]
MKKNAAAIIFAFCFLSVFCFSLGFLWAQDGASQSPDAQNSRQQANQDQNSQNSQNQNSQDQNSQNQNDAGDQLAAQDQQSEQSTDGAQSSDEQSSGAQAGSPQTAFTRSPSIVLTAPLTGHWSVFGAESKLGASLAMKTISSGFELLSLDEQDPGLADELASKNPPLVAIGHLFESSVELVAPYYLKTDTPVLLPFIDNPALDVLGPTFLRLLPGPDKQGLRLASEVPRNKSVGKVYIFEGPDPANKALAESFREALIHPQSPPPTKANPKPSKPRALAEKAVVTVKIESLQDIAAVKDIKGAAQDWVLLALPVRLALKVAPVLGESKLKRSTFIAPFSLSLREVGAAYLAVGIRNLRVAVPVENVDNAKNKTFRDFSRRHTQLFRREPSWASVMAYDATTLASLASSSEEGPTAYLTDPELVHTGAAGRYSRSEGDWPFSVIKLDADKLVLLP